MPHTKHLSIPTLSILQHSLEILKDKEALDKLPLSAPIRVLELVRKNTQIPEDLRTIDAQYQAEVEEVILQMKALNWTAPIFDWHQPGKKYISGLNDLALVAYIQEKLTQDEFHLLMSLYNAKRQFENGEPIILTGKVEVEIGTPLREVTITLPTDQGKVSVNPLFTKDNQPSEELKDFMKKKGDLTKALGCQGLPNEITKIKGLPRHLQVSIKVICSNEHIYGDSRDDIDEVHQDRFLEGGVIFNPAFHVTQFTQRPYICIGYLGEDKYAKTINYTSYAVANIFHDLGPGYTLMKPLIRIGAYSPKTSGIYKKQGYHGTSFADSRIRLNPIAPHRKEGGPAITELHDAYIHTILASQYPSDLKEALLNTVANIVMDLINEVSKKSFEISDQDLRDLKKFYELTVDLNMHPTPKIVIKKGLELYLGVIGKSIKLNEIYLKVILNAIFVSTA